MSAAASLTVASARHDGLQRLLTASGSDSGSAGGSGHVESILEHLAGLRRGDGELLPVLGGLRRSRSGGALVILTTALASTADFDAMVALHDTLLVRHARARGAVGVGRGRRRPGRFRPGSAWCGSKPDGPSPWRGAAAVGPRGRGEGRRTPGADDRHTAAAAGPPVGSAVAPVRPRRRQRRAGSPTWP